MGGCEGFGKGGGGTNAFLLSLDCKTQMGPPSRVAYSAERQPPSQLLKSSHLFLIIIIHVNNLYCISPERDVAGIEIIFNWI